MPIDPKRANAFNVSEIAAGRLTPDMITTMVAARQAEHGLIVDGMGGATTQRTFIAPGGELVCWPLAQLADGRRPHITSGHSSKNPSRPKHHGVDMFYSYDLADEITYGAAHGGKPIPTVDPPGGEHGAAAARGKDKRWWVPDNTPAIACAPGVIVAAALIGTGHRIWLDYGGGMLAGYMHLSSLAVAVGDTVKAGDTLGIVGDSTAPGRDARHLHFEIYRGYAQRGAGPDGYPAGTVDPEPLLRGLQVRP